MDDGVTFTRRLGWLSGPELQWGMRGAQWNSKDKNDRTSSKGVNLCIKTMQAREVLNFNTFDTYKDSFFTMAWS